jgi:thioredoxin-related protein
MRIKKISVASLCLLVNLSICFSRAIAQESGIHFQTGLNWDQLIAKAKTEQKPIFIECFATWCGPCKEMEKNVYTNKQVADYFNTHFINVKVQMDSTGHDDDAIRNWYAQSSLLGKKYQINAYPTFLFFSPDGKAMHKLVGAFDDSEFISKAGESLDPAMQYFTMLDKLKDNSSDSAFLRNSIGIAKNAGDDSVAQALADNFIETLKQPFTKETILFIHPYIQSESNKNFTWYVKNAARIDQAVGKDDYGLVEDKLAKVIYLTEVLPMVDAKNYPFDLKSTILDLEAKYAINDKNIFKKDIAAYFEGEVAREVNREIINQDPQSIDWKQIAVEYRKKFPGYDCGHILMGQRTGSFLRNKMWEEAAAATIQEIDKYNAKMTPRSINDKIWSYVFLRCDSKEVLTKALNHMKKVVKLAPDDAADFDTYANLFYKIGNKEQGIAWENKAIQNALKHNYDTTDFNQALLKMQTGEPTWIK